MIIGANKSGKTTLANLLNDYTGPLKRSQDIIYGKNTIDVPGAYIENSWMYKHLIAISQDASHLLVLIDPSKHENIYSPGFAKSFTCPVIGLITKADLMIDNDDLSYNQLKEIGVDKPYYKISALKGIGIKELKEGLYRA